MADGKDGAGKSGSGKDGNGKSGSGKGKSGRKGAKGRASKRPGRLPLSVYEAELFRLQAELVALQEWVRSTGARVLVIFEGRDAAGKGSAIKRLTEYLNPRVARIVALPAPTDRQRGEWYFQRYVQHLPAAGEIVLMDRSWYNRAGVEHVMGFCTPAEHKRFMAQCPVFERLLVQDGILMFKYWFSISHAEQERRFKSRLDDPMRQWKLSPMDREAILRWEDYSRAKDDMFMQTDTAESPWYVVEAEDKRRARINMIAHLLSSIDYTEVRTEQVTLPERPKAVNYTRPPRELFRYVPDHASILQKSDEE
ncbi:polyphosphate kinase 2 [Arthrobacter sp. AL12]|uniref:polyphosphate kinase 2 n=1 Tax=Arthrobacter sp. AL12 TaxID=3042241 RepID=UPI00249CADDD|nr:polyphosphate kinase 2 [Arthrobacter sp. AL12]MDI3211715.1 polyphosphate kinase 2 [Arthrobacter sp. AL12]